MFSLPEAMFSLPEAMFSFPEAMFSLPEAMFSLPEAMFSLPAPKGSSQGVLWTFGKSMFCIFINRNFQDKDIYGYGFS